MCWCRTMCCNLFSTSTTSLWPMITQGISRCHFFSISMSLCWYQLSPRWLPGTTNIVLRSKMAMVTLHLHHVEQINHRTPTHTRTHTHKNEPCIINTLCGHRETRSPHFCSDQSSPGQQGRDVCMTNGISEGKVAV